jgi:hypothetical protein
MEQSVRTLIRRSSFAAGIVAVASRPLRLLTDGAPQAVHLRLFYQQQRRSSVCKDAVANAVLTSIFLSTSGLFMLITFAVFYRGKLNAFQNKIKLVGSDLQRWFVQIEGRHFKGTFLQSTVQNGKTIMLPHQEL